MFTVAYDPKSVPWRSEEILEVAEKVRLVKAAKQGIPSLQERLAEYVSSSRETLNLALAPRF
jgi:hypothetical protein